MDNTLGFSKEFLQQRLTVLAREAAEAGIMPEVFESLLINLADEMDFQAIMRPTQGVI